MDAITQDGATLVIKVSPAKELIGAEEMREYLRIDSPEEAAELQRRVRAATAQAEHLTGRALITRTYELYRDAFPAGCELALRMPPVIAAGVVVEYLDPITLLFATFSGANYRVIGHGLNPSIMLLDGAAWPTPAAVRQAVRVTYQAGYGLEPEAVPEPIRDWVKAQVGTRHLYREAHSDRPVSAHSFVDGLLDPYRVMHAL